MIRVKSFSILLYMFMSDKLKARAMNVHRFYDYVPEH